MYHAAHSAEASAAGKRDGGEIQVCSSSLSSLSFSSSFSLMFLFWVRV